MTLPYEVWVVEDTCSDSDEKIVAVFSTEDKLMEFAIAANPFFQNGRFKVYARVSLDPHFTTEITK